MNDEWNLTNGTSSPIADPLTIADVLAAMNKALTFSRKPIGVKLNPYDIVSLEFALLDRTVDADPDPAFPFRAAMTLAGLPVYPDADVPRGRPHWVYAADEVPHG